MQKNNNNLGFNNKSSFLFIFIMLSILIFQCFFGFNAKAITYTPANPSGPISGFTNEEYEYIMSTIDSSSSWKFDWGDGNYSDWVEADLSSDYVSEKHSWSQPSVYGVRIKYMSKYLEESGWSSPLFVTITLSSDQEDEDDDEQVYFEGDISINIGGRIHYLFASSQSNEIDSFYNTLTNVSTSIEIQADGTCWIDFNDDSGWDYIYSFVDESVKPFSLKSESKSSFEFPWLTAAVTIALVALVVILLLFKAGIFYVYEEEYEVDE